jgi:hypothetical protein
VRNLMEGFALRLSRLTANWNDPIIPVIQF